MLGVRLDGSTGSLKAQMESFLSIRRLPGRHLGVGVEGRWLTSLSRCMFGEEAPVRYLRQMLNGYRKGEGSLSPRVFIWLREALDQSRPSCFSSWGLECGVKGTEENQQLF